MRREAKNENDRIAFIECITIHLIICFRFWRCSLAAIDSQLYQISRQGGPLHVSLSTKSFEFGIEEEDGVKKPRRKSSIVDTLQDTSYLWEEWKPVYQEDKSTTINIPGETQNFQTFYM